MHSMGGYEFVFASGEQRILCLDQTADTKGAYFISFAMRLNLDFDRGLDGKLLSCIALH